MIVYITTNLINGRKYIGKDVSDRKYYLGSGKALKLAINKYGKHNFIKEVLAIANNKKELSIRWRKIQEKMKEENIEVSLISTNTNLLYVLGCIISGYVYLPQEGDPLVFVKRPVDLEGENVFCTKRWYRSVALCVDGKPHLH